MDAGATDAGAGMELSAIGEQVFAVESIVKKRVRKVTFWDRLEDVTLFCGVGMLFWMLI